MTVRFSEEGLPTLKDGGKPVRSGKWQIMINVSHTKPSLLKLQKAMGMDAIEERIFIVKLITTRMILSHRWCSALLSA